MPASISIAARETGDSARVLNSALNPVIPLSRIGFFTYVLPSSPSTEILGSIT